MLLEKQYRLRGIFDGDVAMIGCGDEMHNRPTYATSHAIVSKVQENNMEPKIECVSSDRKSDCLHSRGQIQLHTCKKKWF